MSSTEDFIFQLDLNGKFVYANQALLDLWRLELVEIIGKDFEEIGFPSHLVDKHAREIEAIIATGHPVRDGNPYTKPGGETRHYEYIMTPVVGSSREVEAIVGITRDVTDQKKRAENAEFQAELSNIISRLSHPAQVVDETCGRIAEYIGASRVALTELSTHTNEGMTLGEYRDQDLPESPSSFDFSEVALDDRVESLESGYPVTIDDINNSTLPDGLKEALHKFGIASLLVVSYDDGSSTKFLLAAYHRQPYRWRSHEIELLRNLSSQIWLGLERTRTETALRESQDRLRQALEAARMVAWEWNTDCQELATFPPRGEGANLPFQLEPDEVDIGYELIHPDDLEQHAQKQATALEQGGTYVSEYRIHPPGGGDDWIWVEDSAKAVIDPDGNRRLLGVVRDVTEWRETELQLAKVKAEAKRRQRLHETIMSSTPDLVFVYSLDFRVLFANDALLNAWGMTYEEAIGSSLSDIGYSQDTIDLHKRSFQEVVETKQPVRGQTREEMPDGMGTYDYLLVPVINADEEVEAIAGTARDITDLKNAELALREADRRKDRFLAVLSHELRNPLAPIKLGIQFLREGPPDDSLLKKTRETIERQTDQLTRLVDDLLDVTRISRDKIELQRQPLNLDELVEATVEDHRHLFEAKEVELKLTPSEEPLFVDGDPNRLSQVVGNLLQNAVKFTKKGGRTEVRLAADESHDVAKIQVTDDGVGMDKKTRSTLFEPFAQADSTLDRTSGGLGLGLSLVKGLVDLHGGDVAAHSEGVGKGSTFTIDLPRIPPPKSEQAHGKKSSETEALDILVIEDNADIALSLRLILEARGHHIRIAYNGPAGLDAAKKEVPDVIVCDIGLPGLDGFRLARELREDPRFASTLMIALTGYASADDVNKSKAAGFDHHLSKPPDINELYDILAQR